jgi:ubiquinone/menaquinone biosynthesis C-methylase UbiE
MSEYTEKPYKGMGMEGGIARWYAGLTKKSLADFKALARRVADEIAPGGSVLEVAPGPGYFAIELAKLGNYRVTGLDIGETFVQIARANAKEAGVQAQFERGDASSMPFEDRQFDYLVCRAAFKNFSRPLAALNEMVRVLKPGGRALIIDMRRDASHESMRQAANEMKLGVVNREIVYLTFRFMLMRRAYTKAEFEQMFARTGFCNLEIHEGLIGLEISAFRASDLAPGHPVS